MLAASDLDRLRVVLVSSRNSLNIGASARAMSNFGFRHLRVVKPYEKAFREARSAVGAADLLAEAELFDNLAEAVADCTLVVGTTAVRHRDVQHPLRRLEVGARAIRQNLRGEKVALLFGSEKYGLSNEDLSHCHWLIRIPTVDKNISMNLGQAVAVCLYELIRQGRPAASGESSRPAAKDKNKDKLAKSGEVERLTQLLLEGLFESGFLTRRRVADAEDRIRRLVRRLNLPARDTVIWLGIFRQMLWKMRAAPGAAPGVRKRKPPDP